MQQGSQKSNFSLDITNITYTVRACCSYLHSICWCLKNSKTWNHMWERTPKSTRSCSFISKCPFESFGDIIIQQKLSDTEGQVHLQLRQINTNGSHCAVMCQRSRKNWSLSCFGEIHQISIRFPPRPRWCNADRWSSTKILNMFIGSFESSCHI